MRYATHRFTIGTGSKAAPLNKTAEIVEKGHASDAMLDVGFAIVEGKMFVVTIRALAAISSRIDHTIQREL